LTGEKTMKERLDITLPSNLIKKLRKSGNKKGSISLTIENALNLYFKALDYNKKNKEGTVDITKDFSEFLIRNEKLLKELGK
jgi:hypothetical protein